MPQWAAFSPWRDPFAALTAACCALLWVSNCIMLQELLSVTWPLILTARPSCTQVCPGLSQYKTTAFGCVKFNCLLD